MIGFAILGGLIIAGVIIWFQMGKPSVKNLFRRNKDKKPDKQPETINPPNAWVLRPASVGFEYVEKPQGIKYPYENDNQLYYKMIEINGELKPFVLPDVDPDKMYYDPKEYANLLMMDCNRKAFSWSDDLFQKISLGVMALIIVGILISFVMV